MKCFDFDFLEEKRKVSESEEYKVDDEEEYYEEEEEYYEDTDDEQELKEYKNKSGFKSKKSNN